MVGGQETSGRGALRDCRRARLVPVTVMKSPSSFEVFVEVFSSGMSISNKIIVDFGKLPTSLFSISVQNFIGSGRRGDPIILYIIIERTYNRKSWY